MDRTAALVVRAWLEDDGGFRARLTGAPIKDDEPAGEEVTVALATTPEGVVEAVRAWLDAFMAGAGRPD